MEETQIEALLESPYWVVDVLPKQVPQDTGGQYFAIEKYWLREPQRSVLLQKRLNVLLKLNCYMDICVWGGANNPAPEALAAAVLRERQLLLLGGTLIVTDPDDTYMTVYDPDETLLALLRPIAASEGLFVWQP